MNLKNKISLIFSLLFTFIYAISATIIYVSLADFREEEFESRLNEKAITSIKLLIDVEKMDKQLLKLIDQNSINKLYDEKILIFDADYKLIYSSIDDAKINWNIEDLNFLKAHKSFFRKENHYEICGVFYHTIGSDFYALISAKDNFGERKLEYLLYILIATYLLFTTLTWLFSYQIVKRLLSPIDAFHTKIKGINENNLDTRIKVKFKKDEIDLLANEFNQMLERINYSYKMQQEFTANASHELRTPLARMTAQLENKILKDKEAGIPNPFNENLLNDVNQLSALVDSLLILSKLERKTSQQNEICRIDELIFDSSVILNKLFPDFKIDLEIEEVDNLEVKGNKSLLSIAVINLFRNAYLYSDSKLAKVKITSEANILKITISNDGKTISKEEQSRLFEPFIRGKNVKDKSGLGLGLPIVLRILNHHRYKIEYSISPEGENQFTLYFEISH
jgi:signal transduction histidine kinase